MRRILISIVAVAVLIGLSAAPRVFAATTEFTATATLHPGERGGEESASGESDVIHILDRTFTFRVKGGISGTMTAVTDFHIRLKTGDAALSGDFLLDTREGIWEGRFSGRLSGGFVDSISLVGHGAEGTKLMAMMTQTDPGAFLVQGVILDPAG